MLASVATAFASNVFEQPEINLLLYAFRGRHVEAGQLVGEERRPLDEFAEF